MEKIILQLVEASPILGIFMIMICGLCWYIKWLNNQNLKTTNSLVSNQEVRIGELKDEIKELKIENKNDKKILNESLNIFNKTTKTFQQVATDISVIKDEIRDVKKDVTEIKIKQNLR